MSANNKITQGSDDNKGGSGDVLPKEIVQDRRLRKILENHAGDPVTPLGALMESQTNFLDLVNKTE